MKMTRCTHVASQIRVTVRSQVCHGRDRLLRIVVPQGEHSKQRCLAPWWYSDAQSRSGLLAETVRVTRTKTALEWRCDWRWWAARTARGPCHWQPPRRSAGALRGGMTYHSSLKGDEMAKCRDCRKKHVLAKSQFPLPTACSGNISVC